MKTDSSMSARSAVSRTAASGWTLLRSEIGPKASSTTMAVSSHMSSTDLLSAVSIISRRFRASASDSPAVRSTSSAVRIGMVARTGKVGILAMFVAGVCVIAPAQTTLLEQGRAAMQRGDYETAANLFEKAVAQNPNSSDAHEHLAEAYGSLAQK